MTSLFPFSNFKPIKIKESDEDQNVSFATDWAL